MSPFIYSILKTLLLICIASKLNSDKLMQNERNKMHKNIPLKKKSNTDLLTLRHLLSDRLSLIALWGSGVAVTVMIGQIFLGVLLNYGL